MATPSDTELWGWNSFFSQMENFLNNANWHIDTPSERYALYVFEQLEVCVLSVRSLREHFSRSSQQLGESEHQIISHFQDELAELLLCLEMISVQWQELADYSGLEITVNNYAYHAPVEEIVQRRGRPRFEITRDQLEYMASLSFSWSEIAALLGVSRMTIFRRRQEFGMLQEPAHTITDEELIRTLTEMRIDHPEYRESMAMGHLRSLGYQVNRQRLRRAIHTTDPINVALRWRGGLTVRRPYSVPGPNSLWHIDGHHKLIRWNLVTHCGIDGYSRMIVFIKCSNNNRARTVYSLFLNAVQRYGLPSRVRSDQGRENIHVAQHMLVHRGIDRGSMIVGSSGHNQRIERLWRDMHQCATKLYYRLFYYLEYQGVLDPMNEYQMFALHYVYIPRINKSLAQFEESWNNHSLRTEHGHSPRQLFVTGSLLLQRSGLVALDFFDDVNVEEYGLEEEGLSTDEIGDSEVVIPETRLQLTSEHMEQLQHTVNPLTESDNYAIELYENTVHFIRNLVENNPDMYLL